MYGLHGMRSEGSHRFDVLARSSICNVEAMKHHEKPVYGIQFHPESTIQEQYMVFENFHEVCSP